MNWEETTVGTSTNYSTLCGTRSTERCGTLPCEILGTSITCSGTTLSKSLKTPSSWSSICGTGSSRTYTGTKVSTIWSTVCRSCGQGSSIGPGRSPAAGSSSWKVKNSAPAASRALVTVFWPRKASFVAPSNTLVSHVEGLVPEEWWSASAGAHAIDIRSCRHHEQSVVAPASAWPPRPHHREQPSHSDSLPLGFDWTGNTKKTMVTLESNTW